MEKSVLDITDSVRHQKQVLETSDGRDVEVIFVVNLRGHKNGYQYYDQVNSQQQFLQYP